MNAKPKLLVQKSLLQMAENSIEVSVFRNLYVQMENGSEVDVLRDGDLSCAVFVSGLLSAFGLIDKGHATVESTLKALSAAGWQEVEPTHPEAGDVILWDGVLYEDGETHTHVGFYMGKDIAISNDSKSGTPQRHHWTFDGTRLPLKLFRYNFNE